ncbi:MAG: hypothetical protein HYZ44_14675 [Bacteroidetes bacterium]|nr:hypothetical protein [Bacteroidota bacterium]
MNTNKKVLFVMVITLALMISGCEGYRCAGGVIQDAQTKEPMDSVLCKVISGTEMQYTDSTGAYSVCNKFTSCVPDCADIVVQYTRKGYKTKTLTNPTEKVIYLER